MTARTVILAMIFLIFGSRGPWSILVPTHWNRLHTCCDSTPAGFAVDHTEENHHLVQEKMAGRASKRVAVVGSGISGLSCAYLLHKAGVNVTLYESEATFGGHTLTGD
jgi:NADPH-dependent 2,4-dienoyl-CoA reductase/sulfur reductase-like enzyme